MHGTFNVAKVVLQCRRRRMGPRGTILRFQHSRKCELACHYTAATRTINRSPQHSKWQEGKEQVPMYTSSPGPGEASYPAQQPAGLTRWARARGAVDGLTVEAAAGMHAVEDSRGGTVAAVPS